MMQITYLGHSCFLFESDAGVKLITDPYTRVGYELPCGLTADVVLTSHGHFDHNYVQAIGGTPVVVDKAGKYSVCGIEIEGFNTWHDNAKGALRGNNVIFTFTIDGITFCHFGDFGELDNNEILAKIASADVWLIPVGGKYTIDAAQAVAYMENASPKLVIPMHYLPSDGALDIAPIESFLEKVELKRIIDCKNGIYHLDKAVLEENTDKIIFMERCNHA